MRRYILVITTSLFTLLSISAQSNMQDIEHYYGELTDSVVISIVNRAIKQNSSFPERDLRYFEDGERRYEREIVLHVSIDLKKYLDTGQITLLYGQSSYPFDIAYYRKDRIMYYLIIQEGMMYGATRFSYYLNPAIDKGTRRVLRLAKKRKAQRIMILDGLAYIPILYYVDDTLFCYSIREKREYVLSDYLELNVASIN